MVVILRSRDAGERRSYKDSSMDAEMRVKQRRGQAKNSSVTANWASSRKMSLSPSSSAWSALAGDERTNNIKQHAQGSRAEGNHHQNETAENAVKARRTSTRTIAGFSYILKARHDDDGTGLYDGRCGKYGRWRCQRLLACPLQKALQCSSEVLAREEKENLHRRPG